MGLFDFLKKKNDNKIETARQSTTSHTQEETGLFSNINKYAEYIVLFMNMQQQGNYAPIAAYEKGNGEITGFLFINADETYTLSAPEVVQRMEEDFERRLANGEINSYAVLYHSQYANDNNHTIANSDDELKAISIMYRFKNGVQGKLGLCYSFEKDELTHYGMKEFNEVENAKIFNTKLKQGKEYFQDRVEIKSEVVENKAGLKISKSNTSTLGNTWCGIFGFETFRKPGGSQALNEHYALALSKGHPSGNGISVSTIDFADVIFKAISINGSPQTILPVIKTDYSIDVENSEINEWENVNNVEAIISGRGRDTFGITYFATDYAENRNLYLTQKKLNIKVSGIAFVLDIDKNDNKGSEVKFSDEFTGYMPNGDISNYGCFDFIGQLEEVKETQLLEDGSLKGYIMNVRLITNPDIKNFFTIDMYVTPENMRFKELVKGMKITGMFQMQGQIAK